MRHTEAATAEDFKAWREHAVLCTNDELLFIIRDCREAASAMRTHNPVKEGFYEDQAFTYADEYRDRTRVRL